MNATLYKSIKLSYETSQRDLDEIIYESNVDKDELISYAISINESLDSWEQKPLVIVDEDKPKPLAVEDEDIVRKGIDDAYAAIVKDVKTTLEERSDLEPKDLKDLASVIKTIEDAKYPKDKNQTKALEVDLKNGIVRYLEQNSIDDF